MTYFTTGSNWYL